MIFEALGEKGRPVIVMCNGSFTTGKGLYPIAKPLSDKYYVILPTYDGHYENGGEFSTRIEQAAKIFEYLIAENITEIALIQGISMGAEVAVELTQKIFEDGRIAVGRCCFDGGPFFHFPAFFRKFMQFKFLSVIKPGEEKTKEQIESIMNSRMIRWMAGGDTSAYRSMIEDMECSRFMTKRSVQRESDACYTFTMYEFPEEWQKKFVFTWSSDEPARKSKKNVVAKCPHAQYRDAGNLGHGGFIVKKPAEYVKMLEELAGNGEG